MKSRHIAVVLSAVGLALAGVASCTHAQNVAPAVSQTATPVAARDIPRGVELTAADIAADSAGTAVAASRIGWVTRRVMRAGEALSEPSVAPPQLVHAGASVTVRAETGGVVVTRTGTALMSGSLGERVRVRIDSQHIVTGIVAASATVKIQ
jgi:flagella basal body P-ring formation protein FlgA